MLTWSKLDMRVRVSLLPTTTASSPSFCSDITQKNQKNERSKQPCGQRTITTALKEFNSCKAWVKSTHILYDGRMQCLKAVVVEHFPPPVFSVQKTSCWIYIHVCTNTTIQGAYGYRLSLSLSLSLLLSLSPSLSLSHTHTHSFSQTHLDKGDITNVRDGW